MRPAAQRIARSTAAALIALAVTASFPCVLLAQSGPVVARAATVTGPALVYTAASPGPFALSGGFLLNPGDRIDTRGGGRVVMDLSDGSMVVIEPQSVILLKDFRQASSLRELFEILSGKVRVRINHFGGRPNPYRMNSPTASIAVRGTEFTIEVGSNGETQVVVFEGVVEVTSLSDPSQSILLEAGRGVLVQAGQDFHLLAVNVNPAAPHPLAEHDHHAGQGPGEYEKAAAYIPAAAPAVGKESDDHGGSDDGSNHSGSSSNSNSGSGSSSGSKSTSSSSPAAPTGSASAYDAFIAGLSDIGQIPFLFRYNAFPEAHFDSLENPAYATQFDAAEMQVFVLPTFGGGPNPVDMRAAYGPAASLPHSYSFSPQVSFFTPLGHSKFFLGAAASVARLSDNSVSSSAPVSSATTPAIYTSGGADTTFYSGSLLVARKFSAGSLGFELDSLRGSGAITGAVANAGAAPAEQFTASSQVSQTRLTAGVSHDFGRRATLGAYYRYGWISANDQDSSHVVNAIRIGLDSTRAAGHTSDLGLRLRGAITPRLSYGAVAQWTDISLVNGLVRSGSVNSSEGDRAQRGSFGFGLGYVPTRRLTFTIDTAAGTSRIAAARTANTTGTLLQNGVANQRFVSAHAAVQSDIWRRLFISASFLNIWRSNQLNVNLFPDQSGATTLVQDSFFPYTPTVYQFASRFSDFGAGWRFSPVFRIQYLFTTDYGVTSSSHVIMLRYTFKLHGGG